MIFNILFCINTQVRLILSSNIIINYHQWNKQKRMINQGRPEIYYTPIVYTFDMPTIPFCFYPNFYSVDPQPQKLELQTLTEVPNQIEDQKEGPEIKKQREREIVSKPDSRIKRRYKKRRTWLEKKYRCNVKGCKCKYSSKIALNSHKRKKHPKRPKTVI